MAQINEREILSDELCDKLCAVTQCKTKDIAGLTTEGAPLMGIQTNDPHITLVAGGYPLFVNETIVGAIGVGGGTEAQDCEIAEYVVKAFDGLTK